MKYLIFSIIFLPTLAHGATSPNNFAELVWIVLDLIMLIIPIIFVLTFIVLGWGMIKAWILKSGDATEVEKGKNLILWGVIGLVIMSGIWGILAILRNSLF